MSKRVWPPELPNYLLYQFKLLKQLSYGSVTTRLVLHDVEVELCLPVTGSVKVYSNEFLAAHYNNVINGSSRKQTTSKS